MRKAFSETLLKVAEENPRVIFLTGDLGFQMFDEFHKRYGPRYINVGVAEAQLVCAAAGLAFEGWRPVAYSIAPFLVGRAFEQIRISVSYPELPVVLVGAGGGYTYSKSGITHHAAEDLALMSLLPGMTVVAPGDPNEVTHLLPQLFNLSGPSYIRIGRYGEDMYYADDPTVLGSARRLRDGERVAIVSTGDIASVVIKALKDLAGNNIFPLVYQLHTVKPLDTAALDFIAERVHTIIVVEEHIPIGGLSSAVCQWRVTREKGPRILRLGPPDALALGNLDREELRRRFKYDAEAISQLCQSVWQG